MSKSLRVTAFFLLLFVIAGCSDAPAPAVGGVTELMIVDTTVGTGPEAVSGQDVSVHYTGWVYDAKAADKKGARFDSSRDRSRAFSFPLGAGRVIQGWDQGVAGMKVGGQRTITIPAEMGYGARGAGNVIPPNASLIFDVELLAVQ